MSRFPAAPPVPEVCALTPQALAALMPGPGGRPSTTRARAVWRWLRSAPVPLEWPETLPEAGKTALATLRERTTLPRLTVEEEHVSTDGTIKWRLDCRGMPVETVLIPHPTRSTVCVSSQSGCTRNCTFCATAQMGFGGQLTAGEIVAQVLLARAHTPRGAPVKNVVFMGMGEPLDNLDEVIGAVDALEHGLSLGPQHVTVSTSGVLPKMRQFVERSRACMALSLHATTEEMRRELMPGTCKWTLEELVAFMWEVSANSARHFFIEYILLGGVNDGDDDAQRLVKLMQGVRARINLIPFNPVPGMPYARPTDERVRAFHARVVEGGLLCLTRETRGTDAAAACGQLVYQRRSA
ncbi:MAG: 23S rRNA (adenine(2503)-C(2))-methyltransferase RlmN [Myxococcota bacterium]